MRCERGVVQEDYCSMQEECADKITDFASPGWFDVLNTFTQLSRKRLPSAKKFDTECM